MKECPLVESELKQRLDQIQKIIYDFDLEDVSNLTLWATELNKEVEEVLSSRLEELLQSWIKEFTGFEQNGGTLIKECMVLELKQ